MKKLIAISVMLALVTGAVFAQTTISGAVETRFTVISGEFNPDNDPITRAQIAAGYVQLNGRNEAGTIGGLIRVRQADTGFHRAFIWWRPIPELRIFLGRDDDGMFSTGNALTDWNFHQNGEGFVSVHEWGFWRDVFPGNWDKPGLAISYYGVENLTLNLVIPAENNTTIEQMFPFGLHLNGEYRIPDVGNILFSYYGTNNSWKDIDDPLNQASFGNMGISFLLTAIPSIRAQLGVSTTPRLYGPTPPIRIGAAFSWTSGNFGIKARAAYIINYAGKYDAPEDPNEEFTDPMRNCLWFNVMPHYTIKNVSIRLDIGMEQNRVNTYGVDAIAFWVNPYVVWGNFRGGVLLKGSTNSFWTYSIPILCAFSF